MGQGDGGQEIATGQPVAWSLPKTVRAEGAQAARAGLHPSACPYRIEDSAARLLWLEAYLAVVDGPDCPPETKSYRTLIDMLRLAVTQAMARRGSENVVRLPTLRKA